MAEIGKICYESLMDYTRLEPCLPQLEIKNYCKNDMGKKTCRSPIQERHHNTKLPVSFS